MTIETIVEAILGNLGTLVTLLVILYGGYKRWWVFGWYARELSSRIDRLEDKLEDQTKLSQNATGLTNKIVDLAEKRSGEASA